VFAVESSGLSVAMGNDAPAPSTSRLPSDRLTHPTVFAVVLVLVLEWNVWFWCVRGRVVWAMRRCQKS
jgi:hypothetical protein